MKSRFISGKKLITIMLGLFTLVFILKETARTEMPLSPPPSQNNLDSRFLVGAIQSFDDRWHGYSNYDELGFNYMHTYIGTTPQPDPVTGRYYPIGYMAGNDLLFTPVSQYAGEVNGYINTAYTHNNSRFSLHRPKIEWLCYGQRSDYKCNRDHIDPALWFYSFQTHNNDPDFLDEQYGNRWVRFCRTSNSTNQGNWVTAPGIVVDRLKANTEQSRINWPVGTTMDMWQCDNQCDWLVKPKIRINPAFVQSNPESDVCAIYIKDENGNDKIPPKIIKAKHFKQFNGPVYTGNYIEEFYFRQEENEIPSGVSIQGPWGTKSFWQARGDRPPEQEDNKADIQVYWYGYCDMWLDYVRVDNDVASDLLSTDPNNLMHQTYEHWLQDEVVQIANATYPAISNYRLEYCEFNNLPCIAYVNRKLREYSTDHNLTVTPDWYVRYSIHVPWENRSGIMTAEHIKRFFVDSLQLSAFHAENYPYRSIGDDPELPSCFSKIPNTLPKSDCGGNPPCGILGYPVSPAAYDVYLQDNMDHQPEIYTSNIPWDQTEVDWDRGMFRVVMNLGNQISKMAHIPFIHMPAAHLWFNDEDHTENQREPTNEELDLQANLSVSYGARGLIYFWWWSDGQPGGIGYNRGIVETDGSLRLQNVYEEAKTKKQAFIDISNRLKAWEPYLMNFDYDYTNSYIYYDPVERTDFLGNTYFNEVLTYPPTPTDMLVPSSEPDADNYRYIQASTFKNDNEPFSKYFMIVNRRCSPYRPEISENGGRRDVVIKLDAGHTQLEGFNNWKIVNLENGSTVYTFDKNNPPVSGIDLGWYNPGEGRLYKVVPVMIDGGTLVCDETLDDIQFSCNGTVSNNDKNVTITGTYTVIDFKSGSTIEMNGGLFQSGVVTDAGPHRITYTSTDQNGWPGLSFTNATVKIYGSAFNNIINNPSNGEYILDMDDCGLVDIRNNVFSSANNDNFGGIRCDYLFINQPREINQYFISNTFDMGYTHLPALQLQSYASVAVPVYIQSNNIIGDYNASEGIYLSNIYNGVVDQNTITGFCRSVEINSSDISLYENTISNTEGNSKSLYGTAYSNFFMSPTDRYRLGGSNIITNSAGISNNVEVVNSTFNIKNGFNTFDVQSSFPVQMWHLYGSFPMSQPYEANADYNCFKLGGITISEPQEPNYNITDGFSQLTFNFFPYNCAGGGGENYITADLGNGVMDTIYVSSGGSGGGLGSTGKVIISNAKTKFDSLCIQMRLRNYTASKEKALNLISSYPDSIQAVNSVGMLYYSFLVGDTTETGALNLKTFLENIILNNSSNSRLINRCNYFIQKCKVKLRQYNSAMSGFQLIMNQNPYSYEALLARWDFMATHILDSMSTGGLSGDGDDDRSAFTKEERIQIKSNVKKAFEEKRITEDRNIGNLKERAANGDNNAKYELRVKQTLKEIVKPAYPRTITEHLKIVNEDIKKIQGTNKIISNKNNNIPHVYRLAQNYPNPFNPITTIKYEIPKDSKVKLVVYDLLGREIKTLVNNEIKLAGYYKLEFNMQNYASGVYFYRIEADDTKGNKFIDAKKMVLIK